MQEITRKEMEVTDSKNVLGTGRNPKNPDIIRFVVVGRGSESN